MWAREMRRLRLVRGFAVLALVALGSWFAALQLSNDTGSPPQGARAPGPPPVPGPEVRQVPRETLAFEARWDGERIALSGAIPSEEVRDALLDTIKQTVP